MFILVSFIFHFNSGCKLFIHTAHTVVNTNLATVSWRKFLVEIILLVMFRTMVCKKKKTTTTFSSTQNQHCQQQGGEPGPDCHSVVYSLMLKGRHDQYSLTSLR